MMDQPKMLLSILFKQFLKDKLRLSKFFKMDYLFKANYFKYLRSAKMAKFNINLFKAL